MFVSFFINNRMETNEYKYIRDKFRSLFRGDEDMADSQSKFIPNEVLAVNLLKFKLKLIDSESVEDKVKIEEGRTAKLNLLIEEADDKDYVGLHVHTYASKLYTELKGKRVRFTLERGVIEDDGKMEDVGDESLIFERVGGCRCCEECKKIFLRKNDNKQIKE